MRRISLLLVCLLALMSIAGVAAAQDVPPTFCGDLAQSDCEILTQSAAAMSTLESAGFQFDMNFNMENIPDFPAGGLGMRLQGNGAYNVDHESLSPLMLSPEALMENVDQLPQIMEDAIRAISADATLLMFFPDNMRAALSEEGTDLPQKAGLSAKMVDGMIYLNLNKLGALVEEADLPRGWFGFDLAGYYRNMLDEQVGSLTGNEFDDFDMESLSQLNNMDFLKEYMTLERVADATVDGESVAVFRSSFDMNALISSDALTEWITQQAETSGSTFTKTDLKEISTLLNAMFKDFNFEITQSIGQSDFFMRQMSFDLDWTLDIDELSSAFGESNAQHVEPITLGFHFTAGLNQFNAVEPITAPENAVIIPLDRLNNMDMIPQLPQL